MAMRTYLSIISINVIRLKTSVKRHRVADCLQHTRHSFQITKDTQKLQGVDPCKWKPTENWVSNTSIRQNRH